MATARKTAAKPAAKTGTAVAKWDERLAARARASVKTESAVATGAPISFKAGILSYMGNAQPDNRMEVVALDAILENHLYAEGYDPDNITAPICFAFGRDEDDMVPHEKSSDPQHATCKGCPMNEWGSAGGKSRGKACKNIRRVSFMPATALDDGAEGVRNATVGYFKVPVTSVKGWAGYVNQLAAQERPTLSFVTDLSVAPDAATQFKLSFAAVAAIDDGDLLEALFDRADAGVDELERPYEQQAEQAAAPPARARAVPKRGAAAAAPANKVVAGAKPVTRGRKF